MNENKKNPSPEIRFATLASATNCFSQPLVRGSSIVNLQLNNWQEAIKLYKEITSANNPPTLEQMSSIIRNCGESLSQLFGRNVSPRSDGKTPSMRECVEKIFPAENKWNLSTERSDLFVLFQDLNSFYDTIRHFGQSKEKEDKLKELNWDKTKTLLKATQDLWKWLLDKKHHGNIPDDQLVEFRENFP